MRIVNQNQYRFIQRQLNNNREVLDKNSEILTTGKNVSRLKDDPLTVQRTLRNEKEEDDLEQYQDNVRRQLDRFSVYETTFSEVFQVLSGLKADMVQLANSANPDNVRTQMDTEIDQLRDHLLGLANTQHEGQYIFSGARTDVEAYSEDGVYHGDETINMVEIQPGVKSEANIPGTQVFEDPGSSGGVNIFELLNDIQTQLQTDPQGAMADNLDRINTAIEQVIEVRTINGVHMDRLEVTQSTLDTLQVNLAEKRQNFEDADYVTAITEFQMAETSLNMAMQASSSILSRSLLDFIR